MSLRNPQALQDQSEWEAYFRFIKNLTIGDIQEILERMSDDEDALEQLKESASMGPLRSREAIGMVVIEAAEEYCRECAREAADGKDMLA